MKSKGNSSSNPAPDAEVSDKPTGKAKPKRIRKPPKLPRTEPPLFGTQSIEMTATGAPVISATQAYYKRPEWEEYSPGKLYFQRRFGKGRYVEFYIMNQQEQQPEFITSQAEREIQECYGVMAARLHAILATYATRQNRPWEESFYLRGSDLIKYLGLDRRKDMTKSQKLRAIADLVWVVGTLGAVIHWHEGTLDLNVTRKSPVWIIQYVEEYFQPQANNAQGEEELCEVVIKIQPGAWAEKFLNREGEQKNEALYQFGYVHQKAFEINPNRQELAAVLTLYLTQNRRAHSSCKYRLQTLLEAIMAPEEIESVREVRQYRSRFVQRFYDALETLTEAGFQIQFDDSFPAALRPAWADLPEETKNLDPTATVPTKTSLPPGYFDTWLDSIISVTCPPDVEAVLEKLESNKAQKKGKSISSRQTGRLSSPVDPTIAVTIPTSAQPVVNAGQLTGMMVRKLRKNLGLSQTDVAQMLGKSQSWMRDLENKFADRPVPIEYSDRLQQIFLGKS